MSCKHCVAKLSRQAVLLDPHEAPGSWPQKLLPRSKGLGQGSFRCSIHGRPYRLSFGHAVIQLQKADVDSTAGRTWILCCVPYVLASTSTERHHLAIEELQHKPDWELCAPLDSHNLPQSWMRDANVRAAKGCDVVQGGT